MFDRPTCSMAAAGVALTLAAAPAFAQQQEQPTRSTDGYYQGTLVCEQMPNAPAILRAPLDLVVSGRAVIFARPVFNLMGTRTLGSEIATGTVDGDMLHLTSLGTTYGAHYQAEYAGTIGARGGTLTGTQSWTLQGGTRTRGCMAAFVKVRWQPPGATVGSREGAAGGGRAQSPDRSNPSPDQDDDDESNE